MMFLKLICLAGLAVISTGCCHFSSRSPLEGKAKRIGELEGPKSGTDTGSIVATFGTVARPTTQWWVGDSTPPTEPDAIHKVTDSLSEVVTGIPVGWQRIYFSAAHPTKAPPSKQILVTKSKTLILEVKYRER